MELIREGSVATAEEQVRLYYYINVTLDIQIFILNSISQIAVPMLISDHYHRLARD